MNKRLGHAFYNNPEVSMPIDCIVFEDAYNATHYCWPSFSLISTINSRVKYGLAMPVL